MVANQAQKQRRIEVKPRRFTTRALLKKYAVHLAIIAVAGLFFALLENDKKRMAGQFLAIASWMVVSVIGFAHLHCAKYRVGCGLKHIIQENDWRATRITFMDRHFLNTLLITVGASLACLGHISQLLANQVATKPILLHIANPILCIVLFRVVTSKHPGHGHS